MGVVFRPDPRRAARTIRSNTARAMALVMRSMMRSTYDAKHPPGSGPILLPTSGQRTRRPWHRQDQPRHLLRLIQLHEVPSTRDQKQFGAGEAFVECPGDTAVQGGIGVAEDDPDRASELFQLGDHLCARA